MIRTLRLITSHLPFTTLVIAALVTAARAQAPEQVRAIKPPAMPLPEESASRGVTKFSFLVYGDTRGRRDGTAIQYEHSLVIDSMLARIKQLAGTEYPVKFVLQSGDAVVDGRDAQKWNTSFVPLIDQLTSEGNVPYFLVPGNHEQTLTDQGMRNYLDAVRNLIPTEGSPRRLKGHTTFSLGYGNTFVIGLDGNIAGDETQYNWVKAQLEGLDRKRYVNVVVFGHQAPFSSGPHGGSNVEDETVELRKRYMPLFNRHHVRIVFSGHEHLFEHWVEHYTDPSGTHRMDLVVSGGGGAPLYGYTGEPNLDEYIEANQASKVTLEHLVKPGNQESPTPYHYVLAKVDGDQISLEVIAVDWGRGFRPYRSNSVELEDIK